MSKPLASRLRGLSGLLAVLLLAACGGPTGGGETGHPFATKSLKEEAAVDIPLWVELSCDEAGNPLYGKYSVVKLPTEKVMWSMAVLDTGDCRIYGAIVPQSQAQPDLCDIRFRSQKSVIIGKCRCIAGKYDLEEGRPTSKDCCAKFPNAVYCKPPDLGPTPTPPPKPPWQN